jgi:hypothetical protein
MGRTQIKSTKICGSFINAKLPQNVQTIKCTCAGKHANIDMCTVHTPTGMHEPIGAPTNPFACEQTCPPVFILIPRPGAAYGTKLTAEEFIVEMVDDLVAVFIR